MDKISNERPNDLLRTNIYKTLESVSNHCLHKISNERPNDLLRTNIYKTLESVSNHCLQYYGGLILLQ